LNGAPAPAPSGSIEYTPLGALGIAIWIARQLANASVTQVPERQLVPAEHTLPQRPQCAELVVMSVSQPAAAVQSAKPVLQKLRQELATHAAVAFASVGQVVPQPPQFVGS